MIDTSKNLEVKPGDIFLVNTNNIQRTYFNLVYSHSYMSCNLVIENYPDDYSPNLTPDWSPTTKTNSPYDYGSSPIPVWNITAKIVGTSLQKEFIKDCNVNDPLVGSFYIEWDLDDLKDSGKYRIEFTLTNYYSTSPYQEITLYKVVNLTIRNRLEETEDIPILSPDVQTSTYKSLFPEVVDFVKTQLGDETLPVELTDKQIDSCMQMAMDKFSEKKNTPDELYYIERNRIENTGVSNGFYLPVEVRRTMFQIVLTNTSPFNIWSNEDMQYDYYAYLLNNDLGVSQDFLTDYYIYVKYEQDSKRILGTMATWELIDQKLFIFPQPGTNTKVAVRYKRLPQLDELQNDMWVKKYTLARAMILLGIVRSTFKMGVPVGDQQTTLNGEDLIALGQAEVEKLEAELDSKQEPLFIEIF